MTTQDLVNYYKNLLILQYNGKAKASGFIGVLASQFLIPKISVAETQLVTFSMVPTSGTFKLSYNGFATAAINWNDSAATIQAKLQALPGLGAVTVIGSIDSLELFIAMTGVVSPVAQLVVSSNTLVDLFFAMSAYSAPATAPGFNSYPVYQRNWPWLTYRSQVAPAVSVTVTTLADETLPLAVQDGFDLLGSLPAVGAQLDMLGKYAGVSRTAAGFSGVITLNDQDYTALIKMAVASNSAGSSLAAIQALINGFFAGEILVFDTKKMSMSYLISASVGSQALAQMFVKQKLLPRPMGVALAAVIYAPSISTFFGMAPYSGAPINNSPFNSYISYQTNRPWLSYANAVTG